MAHIFVDNAVSAFIVHEPHDRVVKLIGWDVDAGKIEANQAELATFTGKGGTQITLRPKSVIVVADEN